MLPIIVYTDGSCKTSSRQGGWGYVILCPKTSKYDSYQEIEDYGYLCSTTNNKAELIAVVEALNTIHTNSSIPKNNHIVIHSDSQYVIRGMTSWYKYWLRNDWKLKSKKDTYVSNRDEWEQLLCYNQIYDISWKWCRGHNGNKYNEKADQLAKLGSYYKKI